MGRAPSNKTEGNLTENDRGVMDGVFGLGRTSKDQAQTRFFFRQQLFALFANKMLVPCHPYFLQALLPLFHNEEAKEQFQHQERRDLVQTLSSSVNPANLCQDSLCCGRTARQRQHGSQQLTRPSISCRPDVDWR